MAKTRSFSDLVQRSVKGDKKFAEALLREGVDALLSWRRRVRQDLPSRLHQGDGGI